eukprot:TRINITY_DN21770_c0_g1_i2.p1 TRINITY_DN21770_c0_g1~~TRINITY_DN21770_c0_g1_i2.p1  ORF type:complete len:276 (+),score=49.43 TRINITY_DN21770_c0_g1_i2:19-846(+)
MDPTMPPMMMIPPTLPPQWPQISLPFPTEQATAPSTATKDLLKGLIKAWPTLSSEMRDQCRARPEFQAVFGNPRLLALLQRAEENHKRRSLALVSQTPIVVAQPAALVTETFECTVDGYFDVLPRLAVLGNDAVERFVNPERISQITSRICSKQKLRIDTEANLLLGEQLIPWMSTLLGRLMQAAQQRTDFYREKTAVLTTEKTSETALEQIPPAVPELAPATVEQATVATVLADEGVPPAKKQKKQKEDNPDTALLLQNSVALQEAGATIITTV